MADANKVLEEIWPAAVSRQVQCHFTVLVHFWQMKLTMVAVWILIGATFPTERSQTTQKLVTPRKTMWSQFTRKIDYSLFMQK